MTVNAEPFVWSSKMLRVAQWTSYAPSSASILTSCIVVGAAIFMFCRSETRSIIKRQSFVMMIAVQLANILSSSTFIYVVSISHPTRACAPASWLTTFSSYFANFVVACIAFNLQLLIVHNVDTRNFVVWYLLGSCILSLAFVIPTIVHGLWGWDPEGLSCRIALKNEKERFDWLIGTIYAPKLVAAAVALVATVLVLWRLFAMDRHTRRMFGPNSSSLPDASRRALFRHVALRIVWYPLILVIITIPALAADLIVNSTGGVTNMKNFRLLCVSSFLLAVEPFLHSLVALFLDPAFSAAIRARLMRPSTAGSTKKSEASVMPPIVFRKQTTTFDVELGPTKSDVKGSDESLETSDIGSKKGELEEAVERSQVEAQRRGSVLSTIHGRRQSSPIAKTEPAPLDISAL